MPKINEVRIKPSVIISYMLDLERQGVEELTVDEYVGMLRTIERNALEQIHAEQQ